MLDRALRTTFRNYSTLFLMCAAASVPAALIFCFIFRGAVAVHELHDTILTFGGARQIAGVGRTTLLTSRYVGWGVFALGILLLPFFAGGARRILERDAAGHAPTVVDVMKNRPERTPRLAEGLAPSVLVGLVVAAIVGVLTLMAGLAVGELLSEGRLWVGVGLSRGVAWAAAVPFVLVPWALSSRPSTNL
jgi:hypothetical protein